MRELGHRLNLDDKMFVFYGNSAEAGYTYSSSCLFIEVGKPGERSKRPKLQPPEDEDPQDKHYYGREKVRYDDEDKDEDDGDGDEMCM